MLNDPGGHGPDFDALSLVRRLESFAPVLPRLLDALTDEEARFKPPTGAWSILEIVNHLADEEAEDFRERLRLTLLDPALAWPSIDPVGSAVSRRYNERDLGESVTRFETERRVSAAWLRSLLAEGAEPPCWQNSHAHPTLAPISAADLLASWAAHDALHLRQIAKRLHELAARDAGGAARTGYAGAWGA